MNVLKVTKRSRAVRLGAALLLGTAAMAVPSTPAYAQEANARLRGVITAAGQPGGTQVTAVEVATGFRRTVPILADGSYNFGALGPGTYRLEVTTAAGVRATDQFTLNVGQDAELSFDLAAAPEAVPAVPGEPVAEAPAGDAIVVVGQRIKTSEGGEVGVTITPRIIEHLPQNNRNFLAFADLAPGVQFVTADNGQSRLQGGAQNSRTVNVFIDGVGQKDYVLKNGVTGQDSTQGNPFPQSAIGEYRVISSNYKAEFDQVSSVAITAVTKSGTNEFHGDAFVDFTNQKFRSRTPLEEEGDNEKTKTRDVQFGGALGGPIIRDIAHFFVTYEGKRQQVPVDIFPGNTQNTANIPAEFLGEFGGVNRKFNEDLYFGKIDFAPSDRDLIEVSAKVRKETGEGVNSGNNLRSNSTDFDNDEVRGLLRYERTGGTWINDLKLTYEDTSWAPTPVVFENASVFEDANGARIFRSGGGSNYQDKGQKGYGIQNDFTYTGFAGHTIKAGAKAKWVKLKSLELNNFNASYYFNTQYLGATFNDDIPFQAVFGFDSGLGGDPEVESKNFQLGLYIQDDWDVSDRLTLNLGIRWDMDRTPAFKNFVHTPASLAAVSPANYPNLVNADYDINDYISTGSERDTFMGAFQPRIGFSYDIDPESRFVLFGGAGRSYDRNQFDFLQQETSFGSYTTRGFRFLVPGDTRNNCIPSPTCVPWDPIYLTPEGRAALVNSVGPDGGSELRFINNDLKVPYSDQYSLGLRRDIGVFQAEIGYTHIESRDGFVWLLGNRRPDGSFFPPGQTQDSPFCCSPPGRRAIILGDNGIKTNSDAVYLKLTKLYRPSSPWSLNAAYTYTKAEENRKYGETYSLDYPSIDDYPTLTSAGVSRHRLVAAGSVDVPFDMTISGKLTLASPPYLVGSGFPGEPFGNQELRTIEGNNKNPFIFGDIWAHRQLDLAITKYFAMPFLTNESRLRLRIDVLNVLNEENFNQYNDNGSDDNPDDSNGEFGDISGLGIGGNPPRTIKFSAGFSF